jgi:hypothetical protein
VIVDASGLGAGVADRLSQIGFDVRRHIGGARAHQSSKFTNRRSEVFWTVRTLLERGAVDLPHHERLWGELTAIEWGTDPGDRLKLETKELLRSRLGFSTDYSDAVAMVCADLMLSSVPRVGPVRWN